MYRKLKMANKSSLLRFCANSTPVEPGPRVYILSLKNEVLEHYFPWKVHHMYLRRIFKRDHSFYYNMFFCTPYHICLSSACSKFGNPETTQWNCKCRSPLQHLITVGGHFPVNDQVTVVPEALLLSQLPRSGPTAPSGALRSTSSHCLLNRFSLQQNPGLQDSPPSVG